MEAITARRILRMLPYFKHRNANGAHIYLRPTSESAYTLLDDLTAARLPRLAAEGFAPATVVETSPGSFQAWLRHAQPLSKELGTIAAKMLAGRFHADTSAADWRRFGRAPGFTNRKPQHRDAKGFYPFAWLHSADGEPFHPAAAFHEQLLAAQRQIERQRIALRLRYAADMAFSICASRTAGPRPTSPPHSPAITSAATPVRYGKQPTSAARSRKQCVGLLCRPTRAPRGRETPGRLLPAPSPPHSGLRSPVARQRVSSPSLHSVPFTSYNGVCHQLPTGHSTSRTMSTLACLQQLTLKIWLLVHESRPRPLAYAEFSLTLTLCRFYVLAADSGMLRFR